MKNTDTLAIMMRTLELAIRVNSPIPSGGALHKMLLKEMMKAKVPTHG